MKKALMLLLPAIVMGFCVFLQAEEKNKWNSDFEAAKKLASEKKIPVLMLFTGSDWCPACIFMESDVFSKKDFSDFAEKNLALMKVDFPQSVKLPESTVKQNEKLAEKYNIQKFPTVLLLDGNGTLVQEVPYQFDGVSAYIGTLKKIMAKIKK